jgi:enoyl-CoA hydratase
MHQGTRYELEDGVALVRLDDGKANALSHALLDALGAHLDRAEKEARAVLLVGREGRFCGGFDLGTMRSGPDAVRRLVTAGAELLLRMLEYPLPIVVACTGHALAAGALLVLAGDRRIGARGEFRIGLNEVAIGMTLPIFAAEIARLRLSKRHFAAATAQARLYGPDAAVDAGYLDETLPAGTLLETASAEARRLGALPQPAFAATKRTIQGPAVARIRESLEANLRGITGPSD